MRRVDLVTGADGCATVTAQCPVVVTAPNDILPVLACDGDNYLVRVSRGGEWVREEVPLVAWVS